MPEQEINEHSLNVDMTSLPIVDQPAGIQPKTTKKKSKIKRIALSPEQKTDLLNLIKEEVYGIMQEYDDLEYFDKIEKSDNEYNLVPQDTDYPIPEASNKKLGFLLMMSDIIGGRAKYQTMSANPLCLLEQEEDFETKDDFFEKIRDREDVIDFRLRNEVKLDNLLTNVYQRGYYQGSAIVKNPFCHETEYILENKTYSKENIADFEKRYGKELANPKSEKFKEWERINAGEGIEIEEEVERVTKHGAYPYRVPLDKFFARLSICDFNNHKVIYEEMPMTWLDIWKRAESKYYDEETVEELKKHYGADYAKKNDYTINEAIVQTDLEEKNKIRKYVVTFDSESEIVLRCIRYPYKHNRCYYINYSARPRDDKWIGYMAYERMKQNVSIAENFVNSLMNEFTLAHKSTVITDSSQDFQRIELPRSNIQVLRLDKGSQFNTVKFDYASMDRVGFIQWITSFNELVEGISSLASGQDTPGAAGEPAAKTGIKMQQTNVRMGDLIRNLQKGDEELFAQCDSIWEQYTEDDTKSEHSYFLNNNRKVTLSKEILNKKVRHIVHGSRIPFDRYADYLLATQTMESLREFYPSVWQDVEVQHCLLNIILNNTQGSIEQNKDKILKPLKMVVDAKKEQLKIEDKIESVLIEISKQSGIPVEQLRQRITGAGGNAGAKQSALVPVAPQPQVPRPQVPDTEAT